MSALDQREIATIKRATELVLSAIKRTFPDDFDRRCIYAAAGMKHLLASLGTNAHIHAGDFCALVVSKDGLRASMQGFGGATYGKTFSHYWLETPKVLIDLAPHLLPKGSSFAAAPIPVLAWDKAKPIYIALRYRTLERYAPDAIMMLPKDVADRMSSFLSDISERWARHMSSPPNQFWLLTSEKDLERASRRDVWAAGVLRFEREVDPATLPF